MNEIQRFKKNRMIPKGQYGLKPHEILGGAVNGETVGYVNIPGKGYLAIDAKGNAYTTRNETKNGGFSRNTTFIPVKLTNYDRQQIYKAVSRNDGVTSWIRDHSNNIANYWKAKGAPVVTKPTPKPVNTPVGAQQNASVGNSKLVNPERPTRPRVDYAAKFNGMNFTDEEKKYMTDAGFDPTNARSVQEFILSKNKNANLGARKGAGIADGYWGDESIKAFNALRSYGTFNPVVDAQEPVKPVNETPIDSPDPFGYESKGNYSLDNAKTLKTDGIRDWTTMMNYIKGNQDSAFSQDMMHRFGSDLSKWNQKDVESAMGVSGHYGRNDRSRIQGFMAGNQKAWNNQRQTAINNYAKKTFLKNQAGMNTLGDAGAGTMAQLDVNNMSERQKFAMGV